MPLRARRRGSRAGKRRAGATHLSIFVIAGLLSAWALVAPTISYASPPSSFHSLIESVSTAPRLVSARGGTVTVTGKIEHATSCQLELLSRQSVPVVYSHSAKSCASGSYSARVTIGANPSPVSRVVAFALVARNQSSSFTGPFYVELGPLPAPAVLSVSGSPSQLGPQGGRLTVTARLKHAISCQLELLSRQSFPVVYASNVRPCTSSFTAHVVIGANPSPVHRTVALALVARDGTSAFTGYFDVGMAASLRPVTTTTPPAAATTLPPAATTTVPAATTTVPTVTTTVPSTVTTTTVATSGVPQTTSDNWSGYEVTGGPYTVASGTFTIPYIANNARCEAHVSEWVGIDGGTAADTSLIQAGIDESETDPSTGQCTPGEFWLWPWWEVLPGPETRPSWTGPNVSAGDEIAVTIWQSSGSTWAIRITDETSGGSFSSYVSYDGPGQTAEWIVEAGANLAACGTVIDSKGVCPLAPYTNSGGEEPAVTWSNLGLTTPTANTWYAVTMVQNGVAVSTPAPYMTNSNNDVTGFTVSYTGNGNSQLRQPALAAIGRVPNGKFLHPIFH
jgi:hypothetical protein